MATKTLQTLRSFNERVALHQHRAILSDLRELMGNSVPHLSMMMKPSPSMEFPTPSVSPFTSPRMSLGSLSSITSSPSASALRQLDEYSALPVLAKPEHRVCTVQFKYLNRNYLLPDELTSIGIGEFVMVQSFADKGHEDLGVVTALYTVDEFQKLRLQMGHSDDADENKVGRVIRVAGEAERRFLPAKQEREEPLLRAAQTYVDRFQLDMHVYGVEYQFDGNVLFVYYVSRDRVDFRGLVQHLVRIYCRKTRIQMKKTNQCREFLPKRFAAESLCTGLYCQ